MVKTIMPVDKSAGRTIINPVSSSDKKLYSESVSNLYQNPNQLQNAIDIAKKQGYSQEQINKIIQQSSQSAGLGNQQISTTQPQVQPAVQPQPQPAQNPQLQSAIDTAKQQGYTQEQINQRLGTSQPKPQPGVVPPQLKDQTLNKQQDKYINDTIAQGGVPNVFGTKLMDLEKKMPGITEKRNQAYIQELQQAGGLTSKNIDQKVRELLQAKGISQFVTTPENVEQTVQNIAGKLKPTLELQEKTTQLATIPSQNIADGIFNGDYSLSSPEMDNLKITDPNKYAEITSALNQKNTQFANENTLSTFSNLIEGKETYKTPSTDMMEQVQAKMLQTLQTLNTQPEVEALKKYQDTVNDPETLKMNDDIIQTNAKIEDLDLQMDNIAKDIREQYPSLSKSAISQLISDRTSKLMDQKNSLSLELNTKNNVLNSKLKNAETNYKLNSESSKLQRQQILDNYKSLESVYGYAKDVYEMQDKYAYAQFQSELKFQDDMKRMDAQEKFLKGDINSKDPEQVKKAVGYSVDEVLKKYEDLPISRSREQIVEDIQNGLRSGKYKSLGQALTENLIKPIQGKPEYQQRANKKAGITEPKVVEIGGSNYTYNRKTGKFDIIDTNTLNNINDYSNATDRTQRKTIINNVVSGSSDLNSLVNNISMIDDGSTGGECGEFANDYSTSAFGVKVAENSLQSKYNGISKIGESTTPQLGGIVAYDSGAKLKDGTTAGHIGIITEVFPDGSYTIKSSNLNGNKKVWTKTYKPGDLKGVKFSVSPKVTGTSTGGFDGNTYMKLVTTKMIAGASKLSDAERENTMKAMESAIKTGDTTYANEILRGIMLNDKRVGDSIYDNEQLKSGLNNIKSLLNEYKQSGGKTGIITATGEKIARQLGMTTDEFIAKAQNQIGVLVADYIKSISGTAASDKEVARLLENMPDIKNVDSLNTVLLDNLVDIADRRMKTNVETFLGNYKDKAPQLFPEIYTKTQDTTQDRETVFKGIKKTDSGQGTISTGYQFDDQLYKMTGF